MTIVLRWTQFSNEKINSYKISGTCGLKIQKLLKMVRDTKASLIFTLTSSPESWSNLRFDMLSQLAIWNNLFLFLLLNTNPVTNESLRRWQQQLNFLDMVELSRWHVLSIMFILVLSYLWQSKQECLVGSESELVRTTPLEAWWIGKMLWILTSSVALYFVSVCLN